MKRIGFMVIASAVWLIVTSAAQAQEEVIYRGKDKDESIKKAIKAESAQGIVLTGSKDPIPAEIIQDVFYEVEPLSIRLSDYRPALVAEKNANDPSKEAKRQASLAEALQKYEGTLKGLKPGQTAAQRHLEYKVAYLSGIQAQEGGGDPSQAITRLQQFTSKHTDSWQLASALKMLAGLQVAQKQFGEAKKSYKQLAAANVSESTKMEAELGAAQVGVRAGEFAAALKDLQALSARLPKDSPFATRALVAQAECLAASKQGDQARKILQDVIQKTKDRGLKAVAYNALGQSYFDAGQLKEARWEFLWVDVVYNQDRNEHAKALYYLMRVFKQLNEMERAQECRDILLSDRQFQGLEYQRLAREEKLN